MSFFSIDSPLYKFMDRFFDMVKLNFLWLLCSIPIVTMGAATTAAFHVALKMIDNEEGYITKDFMKSFKQNLKQGSIMGVLVLAGIYAVWLDLQICHAKNNAFPFLVPTILLIAFLVLGSVFAFALLARYENTIWNTFKNSFAISIRYIVSTIILLLIVGIEVVAIGWNLTSMFVGLFIGPVVIIYTISGTASKYFKLLEPVQPEIEENEEEPEE